MAIALRRFSGEDVEPLRAIYNRLVSPAPGWTAAEAAGMWTQAAQGDRTRVAVGDGGRVVGAVGTVLGPPWMYVFPLVAEDDEVATRLLAHALGDVVSGVATVRIGVRSGEEPKRAAAVARGFVPTIEFVDLVFGPIQVSSIEVSPVRSTDTPAAARALPGPIQVSPVRSTDTPAAARARALPGLTRIPHPALDREAMRHLHDLTFAEIANTVPIDAADLAALLDGPLAWPAATAAYADAAGTLVGFVIGQAGVDERGAFGVVEAIGVRPTARGLGLARLMLDELLAAARAAGLAEVRSLVAGTNVGSLALHRAAGFAEGARRQMYDLTAL